MKIKDKILSEYADEIGEKISRRTVFALQKITDTLSGDDSVLINAWDEICAQIQSQKSIFWDTYDETTRQIVSSFISELKNHEKSALWFQTDEGLDWLYNQEENSEGCLPPIYDEDIVDYIVQEYIYNKAADWSNKRIQAFFERD